MSLESLKLRQHGQHFLSTFLATLLHFKLKSIVARITACVINLSRSKWSVANLRNPWRRYGQLCVNKDGGCPTLSLSEESTCCSLSSVWAFSSVKTRKGLENVCFAACCLKGHRGVSKNTIAFEVFAKDNFWLSERFWSTSTASSSFSPSTSFFLPRSRASLTANHKRRIQTCCESSWSFSGNTSNKTKICCRKNNSSILFATHRLNLQHYILLQDKLVMHALIRAIKGFNL